MPHNHQGHDRHEGHSVAMFRDKFWLSFALTIPTVIWSPESLAYAVAANQRRKSSSLIAARRCADMSFHGFDESGLAMVIDRLPRRLHPGWRRPNHRSRCCSAAIRVLAPKHSRHFMRGHSDEALSTWVPQRRPWAWWLHDAPPDGPSACLFLTDSGPSGTDMRRLRRTKATDRPTSPARGMRHGAPTAGVVTGIPVRPA